MPESWQRYEGELLGGFVIKTDLGPSNPEFCWRRIGFFTISGRPANYARKNHYPWFTEIPRNPPMGTPEGCQMWLLQVFRDALEHGAPLDQVARHAEREGIPIFLLRGDSQCP